MAAEQFMAAPLTENLEEKAQDPNNMLARMEHMILKVQVVNTRVLLHRPILCWCYAGPSEPPN